MGGAPVEVAAGAALPLAPLHIALGARSFGFALGGHDRELSEMLGAEAPADPPLLLLRARPAEAIALFDLVGPPDPDPRLASADRTLAGKLATAERHAIDRYEDAEVSVRATQRGLEVDVSVHYK